MRRLLAVGAVLSLATASGIAALVGSASAAPCVLTGYVRDGADLTAAQIGGNVTGTLKATGCDIGVYFNASNPGSVAGADIYGATYFGVLVDGGSGAVSVNVTDSAVHNIGDVPFSGAQHGVAIYYDGTSTAPGAGTVSGTVDGNTVSEYQKNGITASGANADVAVTDNSVSGQGAVNNIAQNGIEFGSGATGQASGNTIDGHWYTGAGWSSTGLLLFDVNANQVKTSNNTFMNNQKNLAVITSSACPSMYGGFYATAGLC